MEVKIYQELLNIKNKTIQVHYGLQTAGNMEVHQEKYTRKSAALYLPALLFLSLCPTPARGRSGRDAELFWSGSALISYINMMTCCVKNTLFF